MIKYFEVQVNEDDEDERLIGFNVDLDAYYKFYPGKYSGLPESCYPDECDYECCLTEDAWLDVFDELTKRNIGLLDINKCREAIETYCESDECYEWVIAQEEDARQSYLEAKADAAYEAEKDRRLDL